MFSNQNCKVKSINMGTSEYGNGAVSSELGSLPRTKHGGNGLESNGATRYSNNCRTYAISSKSP